MARLDVATSLSQSHRGDMAALQNLLSQYRNYLCLLARLRISRVLQARIDASDVVQETLVRALRDFPAFRGTTEAELMRWLRRILSCTLTDLVRRHRADKRDVGLERQLADELEQSSRMLASVLAGASSSPSQKASRRESARLLADAIAQLPDELREVIILRHFEDLSLADVAQQLGKSSHSVQKLWSRALIKLHHHLEGAT